jgi:ABC-2 type transport system ATP-binding protein
MVEKGVTVMVTTHFMDEAEYCDRIALIYQGHAIKIGTPDELKKAGETMEDAFIRLIEEYEPEDNHANN